MATLNAVIIKSKEGKNGRNKVRISVAHNGETRYIVTDITLDSSNEFGMARLSNGPTPQ